MATVSISKKEAIELYKFCKANSLDKFFIAKDHGVYMGATVYSDNPSDRKKSIHYCKGYNPNTDEDWYENARYALGGDDFGDHLPIDCLDIFVNDAQYAKKRRLSLKITDTQIALV